MPILSWLHASLFAETYPREEASCCRSLAPHLMSWTRHLSVCLPASDLSLLPQPSNLSLSLSLFTVAHSIRWLLVALLCRRRLLACFHSWRPFCNSHVPFLCECHAGASGIDRQRKEGFRVPCLLRHSENDSQRERLTASPVSCFLLSSRLSLSLSLSVSDILAALLAQSDKESVREAGA